MPNKTKSYARAYNYFSGMPWAILKSKLAEIQMFMRRKINGEEIDFDVAAYSDHAQEEIQAREFTITHAVPEAKGRPAATTGGVVAVLPVFGTIAKRADLVSDMSGGCSIESFTKSFRDAVNNPNVKAIVMNIDSPGGGVFGVQELADEIMAARSSKHIVAVANDMACSAAYWLASAADEIVVTPGGIVGSIGVYTMHEDWSENLKQDGINVTFVQAGKYKTEGNPYAPLDDEARADIQAGVDFYYDAFIGAVAKGRGVTPTSVKNNYGQGRVFNSTNAKAVGMVDRVDTLDGVLSRLGVGSTPTGTGSRSERKISHELAAKEIALYEK